MKSKLWTRSVLFTAVAGLTLSVAACGSSDTGTNAAAGGDTSSSSSSTAAQTTTSESSTSAAAAAENFGPGCAAVPTDSSNPGSFQAMAQVPVATAASGNPVLTTLTSAVGTAGLVDTLNNPDAEFTVFAPSDDAFAALGDQLNAVVADVPMLSDILTYHVIPMRLAPDELAGTHTTVEGKDLTITGSGEDFTVGDGGAKVICGNVQTANATVYIIDQVLMPPA